WPASVLALPSSGVNHRLHSRPYPRLCHRPLLLPEEACPMTTLNDRTSAMRLLLSPRSAKARDLAEPGPSEIELRQILTAASRVPDHGKLAPWRFVAIGKENREAFAEELVEALRAEN